uniref:Uncharacterized protein n=1 Tax=Tanacetum cinerariifolium TaxID=118510 RepID=A0A6L2NKH4_TANCI|nr:hypothetical protein [Tanacetum cinerariifolium]
MDLQKMQKTPIIHLSVDILQNTNFFSAFTASADCFGNLPKDSSHPFMAPPAGDLVIDFVNDLGYTEELRFVSKMPQSPLHITAYDYSLGNLKFVSKGELDEVFGMSILKDLITEEEEESSVGNKMHKAFPLPGESSHWQYKFPLPVEGVPTARRIEIPLPGVCTAMMKKLPVKDRWHFQQAPPAGKSKQPARAKQPALAKQAKHVKEKTSKPSPSNKIYKGKVMKVRKGNSEADTEILNSGKEQGKDVSNMVAIVERTIKPDEGQAGSDPGKTPESRPPPERVLMEEDQEQVHIENPPSSSKTLSSMKNLDDAFTFGDQLLNDKPSEEEPGKANVESKVESMIDKYVNEVVKEVVHCTLQAPLYERFRDLSEFEMKEIFHDWMFESGSYRSHLEHKALYDALELSMDHENREDFKEVTAKSLKKSSAWKTSNTREAPSSSSKKKSTSLFEQSIDDVPILDDVHLLESEDTSAAHLLKINTKLDWLKPVPEEDTPETPEPNWVIPLKDLSETENNWADALAKTYKDPEEYKLLKKTGDMRSFIKWYCKQIGKLNLVKADLEGPPYKLVKPYHTNIISLRFQMEKYHLLQTDQINLMNLKGNKERRNALSISKLKVVYYLDFRLEELLLLLWIESEHDYDISPAYDYTIVHKPRAIIYRDRNNQKKMMRESEVHKFSYGTFTRILEKLDFMVKDYKLFKFNPGMEHRIWFEDDKRRSQVFIKLIERRLKISQNQRDLPRDNPLVSVEVFRYDIEKSKSENKGIMPIEMELVLEQTQQGTSHEVLISTEGVEE